jgi:WD40 repeat protein
VTGDGTVQLWDRERGQALDRLEGLQERLVGCGFVSKGLLVTCAVGGEARVWDLGLPGGRVLKRFQAEAALEQGVLSKDRRYFAAATVNGSVWLWKLATSPLPGFGEDPRRAVESALAARGQAVSWSTLDGR